MSAPLAIRINGVDARALTADTLATSRALHYGDGMFRTLLKFEGCVLDRERQLGRLAADAERLGLEPPSPGRLGAEIDEATADHATATLKLILGRNGAGRGYQSVEIGTERLLLVYPAPAYPSECWTRGIAASRASVTLAAQPLLAGIKHLNRLEQVLAARDWPPAIDEVILGDVSGAPVCGSRSNLFWVAGGILHTPDLTRCGVAGIMRERVLQAARDEETATRVVTASWDELMSADEAFVTNSLIGIWPLRALDRRRWPAPGPVTTRLMAALDHPRLIAR